MTRLLPILLLLTPIIEIALFIVIGGRIGVLATIGLVLLAAIAGSALIRIKGLTTFRKVNAAINRGETPGPAMVEGALSALAGILLIVPGFFTDIVGLLLLLPPVRHALASRMRFVTASGFSFRTGPRRQRDDVVDLDPDDFSRAPGREGPDQGPGPFGRLGKPPGQGL